MNGSLGYFIFQVLPAIAALVYAIYLASVMFSPARLKAKKDKIKTKYTDNPLFREVYSRLYSKRALIGWTLIAFSLAFDIVLDHYRANQSTPTLISSLLSGVLALTLLAGICLLPYYLKRKEWH